MPPGPCAAAWRQFPVSIRVKHELITTDDALGDLCRELASAPSIAFDTEFVSEHTYRPQLCLVQVAAGKRLAAIDTLAVRDVKPLWQVLAAPRDETIVHAGREEVRFCMQAVGAPLAALVDVQIAAGLVGLEYPAGYSTLISKLLGKSLSKGETRTDWRRRPLSSRQIDYAMDDVRYLDAIWRRLGDRLRELGRTSWLDDEMRAWLGDVGQSLEREQWRRVAGSSGLSARDLAIVREIWRWREKEAQRRDVPPRRVLRDDLIVELARRRATEEKHLRAVRGMERGDLRQAMPQLSAAIANGLALPDEECPKSVRNDSNSQFALVGQFLSSALGSICRSAHVAPSIVGTTSDVRELIAYRLGARRRADDTSLPVLARGWRAEVVGSVLDDLLAGRLTIRIGDPRSDHPLTFEPAAKP